MVSNIKLNLLIIISLLLLALYTPLSSQNVPPCQAVVIDVEGKVQIESPVRSSFQEAIFGSQLFNGDQIKTLNNSQVVISLGESRFITLSANSTLTISQNMPTANNDNTSVLDLDKKLSENILLSIRESENGEVGVLAGLRSGSQKEVTLLSPRNSKLRTLRPAFKWEAKEEFDQFIVNLFDDSGKIWSMEVKDKSLDFPSDKVPLNQGCNYFWYVEAKSLFEEHRSESVGFTIATKEEQQMVKVESDKIGKLFHDSDFSSAYRCLLGSYFEKEGFIADAISNYEIISQQNPDAPLPHQILGKLFQKIGLTDKAIDALQQAKQLKNKIE